MEGRTATAHDAQKHTSQEAYLVCRGIRHRAAAIWHHIPSDLLTYGMRAQRVDDCRPRPPDPLHWPRPQLQEETCDGVHTIEGRGTDSGVPPSEIQSLIIRLEV